MDKPSSTDATLLVWLLIAAVVLWLATPMVVTQLYVPPTNAGEFGDLYGSINSLFSGLAFAGIFYTILQQQRQLSLQRDELSMQREELRLQREEMAASRGELKRQVDVQRVMLQASIAQISVAGMNAAIEAAKLRAQGAGMAMRDQNAAEIEEIGATLMDLAVGLNKDSEKLESSSTTDR